MSDHIYLSNSLFELSSCERIHAFLTKITKVQRDQVLSSLGMQVTQLFPQKGKKEN
jgi:hypothetical protein